MTFKNAQQLTTPPTLVLCCGLPGSGKTTVAHQLEKELPAVRLCPDDWKADLGIDFFDEAMRTKLEARLWKLGQDLLLYGHNVILENGFWGRAERDDLRRAADKLKVESEIHYMDVPFDELMRRLEIRNTSGGHGTVPLTRAQMEGYAKRFQAPDKTELALYTRAVVHGVSYDKQVLQAIQSLPVPQERPIIIAISGFGGSGKTTLAGILKSQLKDAQVVSIDSFSNHEWYRNADWDNFDRTRFAKEVLGPARVGKFPLTYAHEPWPGNVADPAVKVPPTKYLIVEGCSIFHPDLLKYYDYKIWVDCPLEEATKRAMWRDRYVHRDEHDDIWENIWMPNDRDFFEKYRPNRAADIIISTKGKSNKQ